MSTSIVVSSVEIVNAEIQSSQSLIPSASLKTAKKFVLHLQSTLGWSENKVLSVVCRGKYSIRDIAALSRLDRSKAIPPALERLQQLGLVQCVDGLFSALEPSDMTLFTTFENPKAKTWIQKVNYYHVFKTADKRLSVRANDLFCRILNHPGKLPSWYAKTLNLPRRTIRDLLHGYKNTLGLMQLRLIYQDGNHGCYVPRMIPDFWVDQQKVDLIPPKLAQYILDREASGQMLWLTDAGQAMSIIEAQNERLLSWLSKKQVSDFWGATFAQLKYQRFWELFLAELPRILDHVDRNGIVKNAYLEKTVQLVINHLKRRPYFDNSTWFIWSFDPEVLFC